MKGKILMVQPLINIPKQVEVLELNVTIKNPVEIIKIHTKINTRKRTKLAIWYRVALFVNIKEMFTFYN